MGAEALGGSMPVARLSPGVEVLAGPAGPNGAPHTRAPLERNLALSTPAISAERIAPGLFVARAPP